MALQRNDVELVAVNDPFITTDYMVFIYFLLFFSLLYTVKVFSVLTGFTRFRVLDLL